METELRLGKQEAVYDTRTPNLSAFFSTQLVHPDPYDFDKHRAKFPLEPWGNTEWGNCVKVGQANQIMRLERKEQRRTIPMSEEDVVSAYKAQTGAVSPGDGKDDGLIVLENLKLWRTQGFDVKYVHPKTPHNYKIAAFGDLDPSDWEQFKAASYLLYGVQMGFWLPNAAKRMLNAGQTWDFKGETGPEWRAGSWGGHLVYSKMFDHDHAEILTWGMKVIVTKAFVQRYCDEQYAVVDSLDTWRKRPEFDVDALIKHLREIGASNIQ